MQAAARWAAWAANPMREIMRIEGQNELHSLASSAITALSSWQRATSILSEVNRQL